MRRIAIAAALSLLALLAGSSVSATETEADAIKAVSDAYWADEDGAKALDALDELFTATASDACKGYASLLFTGISLIESGKAHSPVNNLGTDIGFQLLLANIEQADYACRIAI